MSGLAVLVAVSGVCVVCLSRGGGGDMSPSPILYWGGVRWLILCLGWEEEELSLEVGLVFVETGGRFLCFTFTTAEYFQRPYVQLSLNWKFYR